MGLTLNDRKLIEKRWVDEDSPVSIAKCLSCSPGTVYAELTRGHTEELDRNSLPMYDPELGKRHIRRTSGNVGTGDRTAKDLGYRTWISVRQLPVGCLVRSYGLP